MVLFCDRAHLDTELDESKDFGVGNHMLQAGEEDGVVDGVEEVVDVKPQHPCVALASAEGSGAPDGLDGSFAQAVAVAVVDKQALESGLEEGGDCLLYYLVLDGEQAQLAFLMVLFGDVYPEVGGGRPSAPAELFEERGDMGADVFVEKRNRNAVDSTGGIL